MAQYQGVWNLTQQSQALTSQRWVTDPNFKYTTLLLQADNAANGAQNNTFLDASSNAFSITRNGDTTQGTFTPFIGQTGAWSNYFNNVAGSASNNTGNYLTTNVAAISGVGASDFSIECFVYALQLTQTTVQGLVSYGVAGSTTGTSFLSLELSATGYLGCAYASGTAYAVSDASPFPINQWVHVVVCRSGSTLSLFVNGIRKSTTTTSATVGNGGNGLVIGGQWYNASASARDLNGYMSNVRIVVGSSAYDATQSTLTVPTLPLTAITNTTLLTCQSNRFVDNSSNGYAITVFSNVLTAVQAFSPFASQYQWTPDVIGGSGYFDGTGDYLSLANNTAFDLSSGDFTIDAWVYRTGDTAAYGEWIIGKRDQNPSYPFSWVLLVGTGNKFVFANGTAADDVISTTTAVLNTWYHVRAVRSGTTAYLFVNGVLETTKANFAITEVDVPLTVGNYPVDNPTFTGYMCGVRLIKGTALTTSTFAIPTAPPTAVSGTSLLLNFTNAGISDGAMKTDTQTVSNAQIVTAPIKYGSGSIKFNGTTDYLKFPNSPNYAFSKGPWTIEGWFYFNSVTATQVLIDTRSTSTSTTGVVLSLNTSGALYVTINNATLFTSGLALARFVFYHVALVSTGSSINLYVNGVRPATSTGTYTVSLTDQNLRIGAAAGTPGSYFNGFMDDVRITKGIARYTANFVPPSVALPRQ